MNREQLDFQNPESGESEKEGVEASVQLEAPILNEVQQVELTEVATEQQRQDGESADRLAQAIKSGAKGAALRRFMERIAVATAVAGGAVNADAAPEAPTTKNARENPSEQRAEARETRLIKGVASDPVLGQFTVEVNILGAKQDGTFGLEYAVVINGEKKVVQSSRRARTGATVISLEGNMRISVPSGYGAGSENPPMLTVPGKDGNPVELKIEK